MQLVLICRGIDRDGPFLLTRYETFRAGVLAYGGLLWREVDPTFHRHADGALDFCLEFRPDVRAG